MVRGTDHHQAVLPRAGGVQPEARDDEPGARVVPQEAGEGGKQPHPAVRPEHRHAVFRFPRIPPPPCPGGGPGAFRGRPDPSHDAGRGGESSSLQGVGGQRVRVRGKDLRPDLAGRGSAGAVVHLEADDLLRRGHAGSGGADGSTPLRPDPVPAHEGVRRLPPAHQGKSDRGARSRQQDEPAAPDEGGRRVHRKLRLQDGVPHRQHPVPAVDPEGGAGDGEPGPADRPLPPAIRQGARGGVRERRGARPRTLLHGAGLPGQLQGVQ